MPAGALEETYWSKLVTGLDINANRGFALGRNKSRFETRRKTLTPACRSSQVGDRWLTLNVLRRAWEESSYMLGGCRDTLCKGDVEVAQPWCRHPFRRCVASGGANEAVRIRVARLCAPGSSATGSSVACNAWFRASSILKRGTSLFDFTESFPLATS